ncbi:GrpB family protein [Vallitalea guaymasensis]|uniref:GrpB family protein n=1 Tax=Vallitalea guaymasensis TaxID=1185412 RepID=A0A8J8SEJ4_9FIRM|nr:GrpB family protein [Vallitalea guaymasensis]
MIDIQVFVKSFNPFEKIQSLLENIGYRYRTNNIELTKRYFREQEGHKRTHIHVRIDGRKRQLY